jgi:uncharacterized membrane protein
MTVEIRVILGYLFLFAALVVAPFTIVFELITKHASEAWLLISLSLAICTSAYVFLAWRKSNDHEARLKNP